MKIAQGKEQLYKVYLEKNNKDVYGAGIIRYAENWAKLMEEAIDNSEKTPNETIIEQAEQLSFDADTEGITGFMYGCAVDFLSKCWEYGDDLRKWHNKDYGYEGDGVVNPAVITINPPLTSSDEEVIDEDERGL